MNRNQLILNAVKKKIREIDPEAKVILFGSRARDDFHQLSDWDFLILTSLKNDRTFKNLISDSLFEIELETNSVISSIVENIDEWEEYASTPIFQNIEKDGIVL